VGSISLPTLILTFHQEQDVDAMEAKIGRGQAEELIDQVCELPLRFLNIIIHEAGQGCAVALRNTLSLCGRGS
jgi:hypothetical protein